MSPDSNSRRSSSTEVTSVVAPGVMPATIPECGCSPSTSVTSNSSPKSQNTDANTPRMSALMNALPCSLQMSSMRTASARLIWVATTTSKRPKNPSDSSSDE